METSKIQTFVINYSIVKSNKKKKGKKVEIKIPIYFVSLVKVSQND